MARKSNTWKNLLFVLIAVAIVTGVGIAVYTFLIPGAIVQPPSATSSIVVDGRNGKVLDSDLFVGTLYETDDLNDWSDFDVLKSYATGGVEVDDTDISDQAKDFLVLRVKCDAYPHDEDIFSEDEGDRKYYERWFRITPGKANYLVMYQEPTQSNAIWLNQETFAFINLPTTKITVATNVTVIMGCNASQTQAMWVAQKSYEEQIDLKVNLLVEFNASVALTDFNFAGLVKTRLNSTALVFTIADFESLGAFPRSFLGNWGEDAADLQINKATLRYGETAI